MSQSVIFVDVKLPEEEVELGGEKCEAANVVTRTLKDGKTEGRCNYLFIRLPVEELSGILRAANLETPQIQRLTSGSGAALIRGWPAQRDIPLSFFSVFRSASRLS